MFMLSKRYNERNGIMGLLINGIWYDTPQQSVENQQKVEKDKLKFRNWITKDGSSGPSGVSGFKAERNRYHLYVSYACPWASRALIMRKLKGLEDMISISVVNPYMGENGWTFEADQDVISDPVIDADYLHQIYTQDSPDYSGKVTVPVLYDKKQLRIVSNEYSEIIRMFNSAFDGVGATKGNYVKESLVPEINKWNEIISEKVNIGMYKAGFATNQKTYNEHVHSLFDVLDKLEKHLESHRFLIGNEPTEADWRLFPTLIRFDIVYFGHFKCNLKRLIDYKNLWHYTKELYNWSGVSETVNFRHIKEHYYHSHTNINPTGIIPEGPILNLTINN